MAKPRDPQKKAAWNRANRERYLETRSCTLCGGEYRCLRTWTEQAFCSRGCARRARHDYKPKPERVWIQGECPNCGELFVALKTSGSRYCGKACYGRAHSRRGDFWVSDRTRLAIYERDNWDCQLCSEPIDRDAHWNTDWAPTLDHIVCQSWTPTPDHSPSNLRLAHRWCNSIRGDEAKWTEEYFAA